MTQNISEMSRRKHCRQCDEKFEWPEFSSYLIKLRSTTIRCLRCQTENYIVPQRGLMWGIVLLCSLLSGLTLFLLINGGVAIATFNETDGTVRISYLLVIVGAVLGVGLARLIMNIYNWFSGLVTTDRTFKSDADYE